MEASTKIGYILNEAGFKMDNIEIREVGKNPTRVTGIGNLQTGNEKNRNGRIYRTEDLLREINCPRTKELLSTGNLLSECTHPMAKDLVRQQTIDARNSCARFLSLWMEGDDVKGTFQGTNNDLGETFDKDLRMGVKPAFSLRALGTINATPQGAVVENLKLITYDYVIYPSHPHAYTEGILNESASFGNSDPVSNFKLTNDNDATKSYVGTFTQSDLIETIKRQASTFNESAVDYIKDKSFNFKLLQEYFGINEFDTIDIINPRQVMLTEANSATVVMDIEDYISKEIQNYSK